MIALKADGAMRDALTIFDQVVSFSGESVLYQHVIENLNILDYEYYFRLTDASLKGDVSQSLLIFNEILNDGFDAQNFINGLASHLRDLLVSKNPETVKLLEVSESIREKYLNQSARCPVEFLFPALQICNDTDLNYKLSRNQRLLVELALVRMATLLDEKKKPALIEETDIKTQKDTDKTTDATLQSNKKPVLSPPHSINPKAVQRPPEIKKNLVKSQGISIKNIVSGETEKNEEESVETSDDPEEVNDETVNTETDFSQEDLNIKWKEYADLINSARPRIAITLRNRTPVLMEGYLIDLVLDNTAQLEEFDQNIRSGLLEFLKKELKNSYVHIKTRLEQTENGKKRLFTPEERFQYLSRKNPALGTLKQKFNLDFE